MFFRTIALLLLLACTARAEETLATLKVKDEVYTNVTVWSVTATDIYFKHSRGVGNAKLKTLSPELQKHFKYDPAKAVQAEQKQTQSNAQYRQQLNGDKPASPAANSSIAASSEARAGTGDDFVAPKLYARSIRGQRAPDLVVEEWLTLRPITDSRRFVLIDFWATWCGPCRASIPELNGFHAKFKDRLSVIGISDETAANVKKMKSPKIEYAIAVDTQERMSQILEIKGIPHCILIDPKGIVRYEGMPQYLDEQKLEHFLNKYK